MMRKQTETKRAGKMWLLITVAVLLAGLLAFELTLLLRQNAPSEFMKKANSLKNVAMTWEFQTQLQEPPCGEAGYVVFFSVCDGTCRASVYHASGDTLQAAWDACAKRTDSEIEANGLTPLWVKADVVVSARSLTQEQLHTELLDTRSESFRWGLCLDEGFDQALLEEELNATRGYSYDDGMVELAYLNAYLQKTGRQPLEELPAQLTVFATNAWFCDEDGTVYDLIDEGTGKGRRSVEPVDVDYVKWLVAQGDAYLLRQVQDDGAFNYGIFPRFDLDLDDYGIVRHAGTIWAMVCSYRLAPEESKKPLIDRAIAFLLSQVRHLDRGGVRAAYIYDSDGDEFKLGGNALAILAMTEYMDVFGTDEYEQICRELGEGILQLRGEKPGSYIHILNPDGSVKQVFSTIFFDGEAAFALCKMYGLTGEQLWLDAACGAVDRFLADDYAQFHDHWVAYSLNEVTKYVTDRPEYFAFGLRNAQQNLEFIASCDTSYPTHLEFLMASFELYDRMVKQGIDTGEFDVQALLDTADIRIQRQIDGFFYPEVAMYMANPARIVNSFMTRSDTFRVRIDDVQHNMGGLIAYVRNYDRIVLYRSST